MSAAVALLIVVGACLVGAGIRLLMAAVALDRRWPRLAVVAVTIVVMVASAATAAFAVFTASASDSITIGSAEAFAQVDAPLCAWTDGHEVTLMWEADEDATSYDILRSTSPNSGYTSLANVDDTTFTYSDDTLNPDARPVGIYYYRLQVHTDDAPKISAFAVTTACPGYIDTWAGGVTGNADATDVAMQPTALHVAGNDLLVMTLGVVRRINLATGAASVDAGIGGIAAEGVPGPAELASFAATGSVRTNGDGNRYVVANNDHVVYKIDGNNDISVFAGQLGTPCNDAMEACGDGGAATAALLNSPSDITFDPVGNAYITDGGNNRIRRVTPGGTITTVVGTGGQCASPADPCGDGGPGTDAELNAPASLVWAESLDGLIISDSLNLRLRFWDGANITAFAGNGQAVPSYGGDGGALAAFDGPKAVAETEGAVYIAEDSGHVRRFDGVTWSTVAGNGSDAPDAPLGDLGPATEAAIPEIPVGGIAAFDNVLYISDPAHHRVRVVTADGAIGTYAGSGNPCVRASGCGDGGPATAADITPGALAVDDFGALYIADPAAHQIRRVSPTGIITHIAGTGDACAVTTDPCGDGGDPVAAELNAPGGLLFLDGANVLAVADTGNHRVRLIGIDGGAPTVIATVGGTGAVGDSGDGGLATAATFDQPVALAAAGTELLVADPANHRVRAIDLDSGDVRAYAGNGTQGDGGDEGPAVDAQLDAPVAVAVVGGTPIILDRNRNRGRSINGSGDINHLIGNADGTPATYGGDGGDPLDAQFLGPAALAWDDDRQLLYVADVYANRVRRIDVGTQTITTVAGIGGPTLFNPGSDTFYRRYYGDGGDATEAGISLPFAVAVDSDGDLYIGEYGNARIRTVATATGVITTIGGNGHLWSANASTPTRAQFGGDGSGMARDSAGNIYVADDTRIAKIAPDGTTTTYAGTGERPSFGGDGGLATDAGLETPIAIAEDGLGNAYIASPNRIRRVSPAGAITPVAGVGVAGYTGDGSEAPAARISVAGLAADDEGNVYFSDATHHVIRKITPDLHVSTIAGTGVGGFSGDNGPAESAQLNGPMGVAYLGGLLYVADSQNHRVRVIDLSSGEISTFAGDGTQGFGGDGDIARDAQLDTPTLVAASISAGVAVYDSGNHRIRSIAGNIDTIVGTGSSGNTGDGGPGTSATIGTIGGIAFNDVDDSLYIADATYHRIRVLDANGDMHAVAGSAAGTAGYAGDDGPASDAGVRFDTPIGISVYASSPNDAKQARVLVADASNRRVRSIAIDQDYVWTFAGNGDPAAYAGDGGQAVDAALRANSLTVTPDGVVYFSEHDTYSHRIRKVDTNGVITTVAGNGGPCGETTCDDGADPLEAALGVVRALAVAHGTNVGGVYTGDVLFLSEDDRVRVVVPGHSIDTFAGTAGTNGSSGDGGPATSALLDTPTGLAAVGEFGDADFRLYIADRNNNRVRVVDDSGEINTVAGDGSGTISGDGGPATSAGIPLPRYVALDGDGNLYIAGGADGDANAAALRKVDAISGDITTLAGDGTFGTRGDRGGAQGARLAAVGGLVVDDDGNIYIMQIAFATRIRRIVGPF